MDINNRPVTSREYKLILNADRFRNRAEGIETFWNLVRFLVKQQGGAIAKKQKKEKTRRTCYLDTSGFDLRRRKFVLRQRREEKKSEKKFKVTLKYRAPDRYISASQDMHSTKTEGENKFEEDILPPFTSKFSQSTSVEFDKNPKLKSLEDVAQLFPGIKEQKIAPDMKIETVNGFTAHETARWLGKIDFGEETLVKACLSFWYLIGKAGVEELPLIVEFSFDYDAPEGMQPDGGGLEQYPVPVVEGAYRFFMAMQRQTDWIRFDGTTKTAYAYEAL